MDEFLARIGLGCGRFRGGFEESNSRRLLDVALDCGIKYFDTAPSYGGGASERILGRGLRGLRSQVQLCTKVGLYASAPRTVEKLRGLVLTAMRTVLPDAVLDQLKQGRRRPQKPAVAKQRGYGNFDPTLIRPSVERSLEALETGYLDCLMLHEPRMSDPTQDLAQLLGMLVHERLVIRLGVGTFSQLRDLPGFGDVAQFAIGPGTYEDGETRILIGHGVFRGLVPDIFEGCVRESGIFDSVPALKRYLSEPIGVSALLLNAVIFGTNTQRVLVSTNSPKRLQALMSTAGSIFGEIQSREDREVRSKLGDSVHQYLERKAQNGEGS
jgi:hypothetical protein